MADPTPPTKALYQQDESLRTHTTTITSITPFPSLPVELQPLFKTGSEADHVLSTASTIFYAQGGGQPSDTGRMRSSPSTSQSASSSGPNLSKPAAEFVVASVRHGPQGQILHLGRFVPDAEEGSVGSAEAAPRVFEVGEDVDQAIDGAGRDLHSRIHTAGHLVGLAVRRLQKKPSPSQIDDGAAAAGAAAERMPEVTELKAQHFPGAAFVEFRGLIDGKFKDAIQSLVNVFVEQRLPVKIYWWAEAELRERCAVVPDAVALPEGGDGLVRAVDIVGAGAYPCGGTHVPHTGFVGGVVVRKISRQKGVTKVSYELR